MRPGASILLSALFALQTLTVSAATAPEQIDQTDEQFLNPIQELADAEVEIHCFALAEAVFIYRMIMKHNPVFGTDVNRGKNLSWVEGLRVRLRERGMRSSEQSGKLTQKYLEEMGPVRRTIDLSKYPILVSDKSVCEKEYGIGHE